MSPCEEPPVLVSIAPLSTSCQGQASRRASGKHAPLFSLKTKGTEVTREVWPTGLLSAVLRADHASHQEGLQVGGPYHCSQSYNSGKSWRP